MHFISVLVLFAGLDDVSRHDPTKAAPVETPVVIVNNAVEGFAFKQITSVTPLVVSEVRTPVATLEKGLSQIRKLVNRPILAMCESKGWFIYATSVVKEESGRPTMFLSGYAIKRDGRQFVAFSVW
jgi:hypothetical protein